MNSEMLDIIKNTHGSIHDNSVKIQELFDSIKSLFENGTISDIIYIFKKIRILLVINNKLTTIIHNYIDTEINNW